MLLDSAFKTTTLVTVNAASGSVPFWEALGFVLDGRPDTLTVYVEIEPLEHGALLTADFVIFDCDGVVVDSEPIISVDIRTGKHFC